MTSAVNWRARIWRCTIGDESAAQSIGPSNGASCDILIFAR